MGINKYNAERYYDPTAYEGLCRVQESEKRIKICHPTGYMEVNMDQFFPCTLQEARKVFALVHKHSPEGDKNRLIDFLKNKERYCFRKMRLYAEQVMELQSTTSEYRELMRKFKEAKTLHQRMKRNIELYQEGEE